METVLEEGDVLNKCPRCGGGLNYDEELGELFCRSCAVVVQEQVADLGPEWKALDPEDKTRRVRVGAPLTLSLHDLGLTTEIDSRAQDSQGRALPPQARISAGKMRRWQNRVRTTSTERSLSQVLSKIGEVVTRLALPKSVAETAARVYRRSHKMKVVKSRSIKGVTAAVVYLACRKCGVSRTLNEISQAVGVKERNAARYFRLLLREVEDTYIPPPTIESYISKLVNMAKIDARVERLALHLVAKTRDSRVFSGKTPSGLAAAYVYIAAVLLGEKVSQREVAELANVTEVTVRNRCRELLEAYVIRQRLKPQGRGKSL